ncbi:uncharacterized protein LOC135157359 [Lytechinus pictus]|uniref:uncharacterized protein LOC135157359 n=1 Tax=Lytechinus pictus TaxID=7653 RepID=UPI0030B9F687
MKKPSSKLQKAVSNSKRQRPKKLSKKRQNHQGSILCSCFDQQPSPDSSCENITVDSASRIDCAKSSQINLPVPAYMKQWTSEEEFMQTDVTMVTGRSNHQDLTELSKGTGATRGVPNSQNTTSEARNQTNRRPSQTNSCDLVGLFYTIVADDCLLSQPSDSEDSNASDIILKQEIEADVHYGSNASCTLSDVEEGNEPRHHSDIAIQLHNKDDSAEADTWFAHENEPSSNVDLRSEEVTSLKKAVSETLNLNQNLNDESGTTEIACISDTHRSMENLCATFSCQQSHDNLFQEEEAAATNEDCDSSSNISVETVNDATLSCHSVNGDTSSCVSGTYSVEFHDSNRTASANIPKKSGNDLDDCSAVDNTVDPNTITLYDQTTPPQSFTDTNANAQERSNVFSEDQAVTEIIARGRRMADEVKQLISELLDVCMQSRGSDAKSVTGHGDFGETPAAASLAACELAADSSAKEDVAHREDLPQSEFSQGCDRSATDINTDEMGDFGAHGRESWPFSAETSSKFDIHEVGDNDECENSERSIDIEVISTPDDRNGNGEILHQSESDSNGPEILISPCEGFNQPEHLEDGARDRDKHRKSISPPDHSNIKRETLMETDIGDDHCDITGHGEDAERNPTNLSRNNSKHNISDSQKDNETSSHTPGKVEPETGTMPQRTDMVWPVEKIIGYDLIDEKQIQEGDHDSSDMGSPHVVEVIGVDVHPDSQSRKANSSEELDIQEGEHTCTSFKSHKIKLIGIDVENPNRMNLCDIKIIGLDVEAPFPDEDISELSPGGVQVNEEGDSARIDTNVLGKVKSQPNKRVESSELGQEVIKDQLQADGDTSHDEKITQEVRHCGITELDQFSVGPAESHLDSHPGQDTADDPATELLKHGGSNPCQDVLGTEQQQEARSPADYCSSPSDSSSLSPGYPSSPCSSFEIIQHQDVLEGDLPMVPYSPSIRIPLPQQEYNEGLMSPEYEADDIIVNFAAVSAMGDIVPMQHRSGVSPSPPEPVQFEDVNSRSPSPLPQSDLTLLDCLFDICEESLQRFPLKWPPSGEISVKHRSPCKLSLDCIEDRGDRIKSMDSEQSSDIRKELLGNKSGQDEGFFCCETASIDSHCSLTSAETAPESSLTDDSSDYLSCDKSVEVEEESRYENTATSLEIVPGFGCRASNQGIFNGILHPNISPGHTDQILSSQGLKDQKFDTQADLGNTLVAFNTADLDKGVEEDNFVFFLALLTFSLFVYCKYGTRVLQTIIHWVWICQLIIQLITDS